MKKDSGIILLSHCTTVPNYRQVMKFPIHIYIFIEQVGDYITQSKVTTFVKNQTILCDHID